MTHAAVHLDEAILSEELSVGPGTRYVTGAWIGRMFDLTAEGVLALIDVLALPVFHTKSGLVYAHRMDLELRLMALAIQGKFFDEGQAINLIKLAKEGNGGARRQLKSLCLPRKLEGASIDLYLNLLALSSMVYGMETREVIQERLAKMARTLTDRNLAKSRLYRTTGRGSPRRRIKETKKAL